MRLDVVARIVAARNGFLAVIHRGADNAVETLVGLSVGREDTTAEPHQAPGTQLHISTVRSRKGMPIDTIDDGVECRCAQRQGGIARQGELDTVRRPIRRFDQTVFRLHQGFAESATTAVFSRRHEIAHKGAVERAVTV